MKDAFTACLEIMNLSFQIEGFTFTLWQIFLFFAVMFLVLRFFFRIFE